MPLLDFANPSSCFFEIILDNDYKKYLYIYIYFKEYFSIKLYILFL